MTHVTIQQTPNRKEVFNFDTREIIVRGRRGTIIVRDNIERDYEERFMAAEVILARGYCPNKTIVNSTRNNIFRFTEEGQLTRYNINTGKLTTLGADTTFATDVLAAIMKKGTPVG